MKENEKWIDNRSKENDDSLKFEDFKKNQNAFYYVRVIENPACRWSTWDSIRAGEKPRSDIDATIQERAWSSPIWLKTTVD